MKVAAEEVIARAVETGLLRTDVTVDAMSAGSQGGDVMMTVAETCIFFGGPYRPIHYSTLYRGIAAGRYPEAVRIGANSVRWSLAECMSARQRLMNARGKKSAA